MRIEKYIIQTFKSLKTILLYANLHSELNHLKINTFEECIILGNGPSLRETLEKNFEFLSNKKKFVVNQFAVSDYFEKIKPDYYLFLDYSYWSANRSEQLKKTTDNIINLLKEKTKWPMLIFLPWSSNKKDNIFLELPHLNNNIKILFFNNVPIYCFKSLKYFFYQKNLSMPEAQNVLVSTLFLGLNMGFKVIYLFGADHSWHENLYLDQNNVVCWKDSHFYDPDNVNVIPIYKDAEETQPFKMDEIFAAFSRMFAGYMELEDYSKFLNAKIYNASRKTFIDAFERFYIP